ncbi:ATP-dependent RNA helicase [Enterocytozoon bieneusi H348]|nr:ATP-dependent RNA helicase [Enterocytozoon bieneusi H348]|eukprot:XP_002651939.1 ATP-dependent RNA helicase [Enterocytozoon bieneusi H348]
MLSRKINLDGRVEITTPNENTHAKDRDMVVVDEFDRILEERSLRERFERMVEGYEGQRVYFSATLPNEPIKDIETIIRLESRIPEAIEHFFYYVPSESKENALLSVLDRSLKTIIFASTKYGVVLLLEKLNNMGFGALGNI